MADVADVADVAEVADVADLGVILHSATPHPTDLTTFSVKKKNAA